jgi:hypothetical protein
MKNEAGAGSLKTHFSPLFHTISHFKKKTGQGQARRAEFFFWKQALSTLFGGHPRK